MNKEKVICPCKKLTKGQLLTAMAGGASTFKELKQETGVAGKCGKCEDKVKKFVKKHRDD